MPIVNGKEFPYTRAGRQAAQKARYPDGFSGKGAKEFSDTMKKANMPMKPMMKPRKKKVRTSDGVMMA